MLFKAHTGPKIRSTPWPSAGKLPSESYRQLSQVELELIYFRSRTESGNRVVKDEKEPWTWQQYAYLVLMVVAVGIVLGGLIL
jgi:hypothetical protein